MVQLTPSLDLITDTYYFILFPLMVIEGPVVMIIAGFLVSLGYYGLGDVIISAVVAALCGDFLHYAAGRWGRKRVIDRWGRYVGITPKSLARTEQLFEKHPGKALMLNKWSFAFTGVGLVAAGAVKMPLRRFFIYNLLAEIPKSAALVLVGYYLGDAYAKANRYLTYSITVITIIGVMILAYYLISKRLKRDLEV